MFIKIQTRLERRVGKLTEKFHKEIENNKKEPVKAEEYTNWNEKFTKENQQQLEDAEQQIRDLKTEQWAEPWKQWTPQWKTKLNSREKRMPKNEDKFSDF